MKKKETTPKEEPKKTYKKYKRTPSTFKSKTPVKKKEKEIHLCSKCLKEIKPSLLQWVSVTDQFGADFQILVCEDCLAKKETFVLYQRHEIVKPLYKKRVLKTKEVKEPKKKISKKKDA